jgi:hypothetical protein
VPTDAGNRSFDPLEECKHDVAVAAQEEREAQNAFFTSRESDGGDCTAEDEHRRRALLARWQAAARGLAAALENLDLAQRARQPAHRHQRRREHYHTPD